MEPRTSAEDDVPEDVERCLRDYTGKQDEKKTVAETVKQINADLRTLEEELIHLMHEHALTSLPVRGGKMLRIERKLKEVKQE